jgi:hypothetical protein
MDQCGSRKGECPGQPLQEMISVSEGGTEHESSLVGQSDESWLDTTLPNVARIQQDDLDWEIGSQKITQLSETLLSQRTLVREDKKGRTLLFLLQ